ncbi:hypothetical protein ACIGXF_14965 [Streptomyces sp. NPDC053086]|uniref:hypothetical protein n=1 Tax=unclassified Streptomyces TaxID=2593676 RepID=UPI0037D098A9
MAEAKKPGQRVILEFDREVTEEQVREMQAAHNATDAFLETAGGHHHHDDDDEETEPEEEPE